MNRELWGIFFMFKKIILLGLFIALACSLSASEPEFLYLSATNVRMRATPSTSAAVVATLPLGTRGKIAGRTPERHDLLGKSDYWYQIDTDDKKAGWVFGGLTVLFGEADQFLKALELVNSRLGLEESKPEDATQLYTFVRKIKEQVPHSADRGKFELAYLNSIDAVIRANSSSGKAVDSGHKVVVENKDLVYHHECAGQYFVKPEIFWSLSEKFAQFPEVSDDIAWAAANQPQQGETEGDPDMVLAFFESSTAVYLEKFPQGKHLIEAFERGAETFKFVSENINAEYFGSAGAQDREKFIERLEKLEKISRQAPTSPAREGFINALAAVCAKI